MRRREHRGAQAGTQRCIGGNTEVRRRGQRGAQAGTQSCAGGNTEVHRRVQREVHRREHRVRRREWRWQWPGSERAMSGRQPRMPRANPDRTGMSPHLGEVPPPRASGRAVLVCAGLHRRRNLFYKNRFDSPIGRCTFGSMLADWMATTSEAVLEATLGVATSPSGGGSPTGALR